jgi:hypothetical protein
MNKIVGILVIAAIVLGTIYAYNKWGPGIAGLGTTA